MSPLEYLDYLIMTQENFARGMSENPVQVSELKMLKAMMEQQNKKK